MPQEIFHETFPNGLALLAERMKQVRSAALTFWVPAGCAYDPPRHLGIASVLSDLIIRGAGERNSRELTLALDNLGLDRDESVGSLHLRFWAATLARNLSAALEIYADILPRPHLPHDQIDAVKALAFQELHSIEDQPNQNALLRRPGRGQRSLRRHESSAVHGSAGEARAVLRRLGQLSNLQRPRQRSLIRRPHQRARPRDIGCDSPGVQTPARRH